MPTEKHFLSESDQKIVVDAIQQAELQTSGEIKVHIEKNCTANAMDRAVEVFELLKMHETEQRNAVLFYLAHEDRKFAVLGDIGIHDKVKDSFWNSTKELLRTYFAKNEIALGLSYGIQEAGIQLKKHFPYQSDDINELPDDISFG
jgi:uncharacterized membrane protein|tara:strand:- start:1108 stop:1545 length:438 start_codon:yes stop_codon:yes gene_type:complete